MSAVDAILKAARNQIPVQTRVAKVTSVNEQEMTCDVDVEGLAPRKRVRLRAVISGSGGFVVIPQVGSYVLIGLIDNKPESCVVVATSDVSSYVIKTEQESLKKIIADLIDAINQITVNCATPNSPSGVPLNALAFTAIKQRLNLLLKE